jgi:hypothetical protein
MRDNTAYTSSLLCPLSLSVKFSPTPDLAVSDQHDFVKRKSHFTATPRAAVQHHSERERRSDNYPSIRSNSANSAASSGIVSKHVYCHFTAEARQPVNTVESDNRELVFAHCVFRLVCILHVAFCIPTRIDRHSVYVSSARARVFSLVLVFANSVWHCEHSYNFFGIPVTGCLARDWLEHAFSRGGRFVWTTSLYRVEVAVLVQQ